MRITDYEMPYDIEDDPDAQQVLRIYAQVRPDVDISDPDQRGRLLEDFEDGQEVFVARDDDDEIVGVTNYYLPRNEDYLFLSGTATDRTYQGQGVVGPLMMEHLKTVAVQHGRLAIEGISLETALPFYSRLGATMLHDNRLRIEL